jgi:hypothetical protein
MTFGETVSAALTPAGYLAALGFFVHKWQSDVLRVACRAIQTAMAVKAGRPVQYEHKKTGPQDNRISMLCARQSGKSSIVAALALWVVKTFRGAVVLIAAPTEKQAQDTMRKIKELMSQDRDIKDLHTDSRSEVVLENGSRIVSKPWTSIRGESAPDLIIMDEAGWIPDEAYVTVRPTLTNNPFAVLVMLTTPHGKRGFFYKAWSSSKIWTKFMVHTGFTLRHEHGGPVVGPVEETEEQFSKRLAAEGIHAYFSPQHRLAWLTEELDEIGEHGWRQEYGLEFLDTQDQVFDTDLVMRAFSRTDVKPFERYSDLKREDAVAFVRGA